ncbi:MAG: uroporphyrinogen-III C-methyltransferase [Blastocatellia bacterium]|nr:uroporphyrinogen-III C-methyltransferase [Blastocatellia bacterium]
MKQQETHGILVVGHGSRRPEANRDVQEVARHIALRGGYQLVEAAFLEIAEPTIFQGFAALVARGATSITVHPYFLSPGRHIRGDVPKDVAEAATHFPGVQYRITEPLAGHAKVVEASLARIKECTEGKRNVALRSQAQPGTVYLVGAGPGDPGLLTVRARDLLQSCDVVLYDYLVNPEILELARPETECVYTGKIGGGAQTSQTAINQELIVLARKNKRVVRLKGGDPLVFGRGGEEAEALATAGIRFEIVPGISSALAVPAYAGIPVTHRGLATSFAVVTGTCAGTQAQPESLQALAQADTIVVLMGVAQLPDITHNLISTGRPATTPVAVIRWGSYDRQQTVTGTLATIVHEVEQAGLTAPAVIVIGNVVTLRERIKWFEQCCRTEEMPSETGLPLLAIA